MIPPWAILGTLSTIGLLVSLYFVAVTYRWIRPDARFIPAACRMDPGSCARVVDTPYARALGIPNAVPGTLWYAGLLVVSALGMQTGSVPYCGFLAAAATLVLCFSVFLAWALMARLRVVCTLCFTAHAVNLLVLADLAWACLP